MKKTKLLIALSIVFCGQISSAHPIRTSLLDGGERLLENADHAPSFLSEVDRLDAEAPLSQDERAYLRDLTEKLPERLRQQICPSGDELICGPELPARERNPLFAGSFDHRPVEQSTPKAKAWGQSWLLAVVAGGLLLSYGFRGKEIQINAP